MGRSADQKEDNNGRKIGDVWDTTGRRMNHRHKELNNEKIKLWKEE